MKKIIFFSLFLVSTWCGSQVYSVAFFANAFPFAFKNEAGNVTGLDVDLMRAIAKNQKLNIELFTHDWSELFEKLDNGSRDIVMGGITITPERQRLYGTSEPYFTSEYAVGYLPTAKITPTVTNLDSLKIAVPEESTEEKILLTVFGISSTIKKATLFLGLKALAKQEADALFSSYISLSYLRRQHPEIKMNIHILKLKGLDPEDKGILVRWQDKELLDKIQTGLRNLRANGEYDAIVHKWIR